MDNIRCRGSQEQHPGRIAWRLPHETSMAVWTVDKTPRDIRRPSERVLVGRARSRVHTSGIGPGYSLLIVLIPESNLAGLAQIVFDRLRNRIADPAVCAEQCCLISASLSGTRSTVALTRFARACGFCRLADRGALATAGVSKTGCDAGPFSVPSEGAATDALLVTTWSHKSAALSANATGTRIGHGVPGCAYNT